jgi:hypothetical protein
MERLNDDGQWIIMLALIISVSIFFLALIVNESVLVGQTTAESVLDLPKSDIQDFRYEVMRESGLSQLTDDTRNDISVLSIKKKNAIVLIAAPTGRPPNPGENISLHFNNGVTSYNETMFY